MTTLPIGKKAIGLKWVYKFKLKPDGTVDRYKGQLVAVEEIFRALCTPSRESPHNQKLRSKGQKR